MKIILEREQCIGCGSCVALCPNLFEMKEDGKSFLKGSEKNKKTGKYEADIKESDCAKEAAEVCPVQIINIIEE